MFNRHRPPENAKELISALRLEPFTSDQGCGNQAGLLRLTRGIEANARNALQASRILQRTYPPPPRDAGGARSHEAARPGAGRMRHP